MNDLTIQPTIFGWPLFLMLACVFLINFLLCRMVTAKLIQKRFIKKNSIEFQKAFIMWFFPVVGFCGLLMYLYINKFMKFWKSFGKWLFLKPL